MDHFTVGSVSEIVSGNEVRDNYIGNLFTPRNPAGNSQAKTKTSGKLDSKENRRNCHNDTARNKRTIFVGNLPLSSNRKFIRKYFSAYGTIESVRLRAVGPTKDKLPKKAAVIKKLFSDNTNNINAYVVFEKEESAKCALERNGSVVEGMHLRVDMAEKSQPNHSKSIFVGNLPYDIQEETFREHFVQFGEIAQCRVVRNKGTLVGKGFGYIEFQRKESATAALEHNGSRLLDRKIRVTKSESRSHASARASTAKKKFKSKERKRTLRVENTFKHPQGGKHKTTVRRNERYKKTISSGTDRLRKASGRRDFKRNSKRKVGRRHDRAASNTKPNVLSLTMS